MGKGPYNSEPASLDEYNRKFQQNVRITGTGFEVATHFPCPFCAEPEWKTVRVIYNDEDMQRIDDCHSCGRWASFLVVRTTAGVTAELVQRGGADPPAWLVPPPRRVDL